MKCLIKAIRIPKSSNRVYCFLINTVYKKKIFVITQYATKVKALIDAGTCQPVSTTTTLCGSNSTAYSHYETFIYGNYRVVIVSGVPNHNAEYNQTSVNPNTRCKLKQSAEKKTKALTYIVQIGAD